MKKIKVLGHWNRVFEVPDIQTAVKKAQELADLLDTLNLQITGLQFIEFAYEQYDEEDTEFEEIGEEE